MAPLLAKNSKEAGLLGAPKEEERRSRGYVDQVSRQLEALENAELQAQIRPTCELSWLDVGQLGVRGSVAVLLSLADTRTHAFELNLIFSGDIRMPLLSQKAFRSGTSFSSRFGWGALIHFPLNGAAAFDERPVRS